MVRIPSKEVTNPLVQYCNSCSIFICKAHYIAHSHYSCRPIRHVFISSPVVQGWLPPAENNIGMSNLCVSFPSSAPPAISVRAASSGPMLSFKLGRRRRKKCDEIKPTCTGCTRNQLTCVWPLWKTETSRKQAVEARAISKSTRKKVTSINPKECLSERSWPCQPSLRASPKSPLRESFDPVPTISIDEDAQFSIISYCINYYLPIQVHHNPERDPVDQSYLISMSLCFPPLMNALLACSALTLRFGSKDWPSFAIQSYVLSLHEVRQGIADGRFTGTEDHLLATVMWLSIFEVTHLHTASMLPSLC